MSSVTILQSCFAPNIYDFKAMISSDRVWLCEGYQWSRKGRSHRAAIRNLDQLQWVGIPIRTEDKKYSIRQLRIDKASDWTIPFLNAIKHSYSQALYYDYYWKEFESLILGASQLDYLWEFNKTVLFELLDFISYGHLVERIQYIPGDINWDELDHFDQCIQEQASHTYMSPIKGAVSSFDPNLRYAQHKSGFLDQVSLIDVLFEIGPESFKVFKG